MLYIASIPGLIVGLGMQFAVDSPRWLCKVGLFVSLALLFSAVSKALTFLLRLGG